VQTIGDEIAQYYHGNFYIADDFDQYELNMYGELTQLRTGKPWEK